MRELDSRSYPEIIQLPRHVSDFQNDLYVPEPPVGGRDARLKFFLDTTFLAGELWPPESSDKNGHSQELNDIIAISERTEDPIDFKNAKVIGMAAAVHKQEVQGYSFVDSLGVARHLGMAYAIGGAILTELELSEEAISLAACIQLDDLRCADIPLEKTYQAPGPESALRHMKDIIARSNPWQLVDGSSGLLSGLNRTVQERIDYLLPGMTVLKRQLAEGETPALKWYKYILGQVRKSQIDVAGRKELIDAMIAKQVARSDPAIP